METTHLVLLCIVVMYMLYRHKSSSSSTASSSLSSPSMMMMLAVAAALIFVSGEKSKDDTSAHSVSPATIPRTNTSYTQQRGGDNMTVGDVYALANKPISYEPYQSKTDINQRSSTSIPLVGGSVNIMENVTKSN